MREAGYGYAVIGGVGPAEFYEKVCGATIIPGSERSVYGELAGYRNWGSAVVALDNQLQTAP
jgi:hypothetical protein